MILIVTFTVLLEYVLSFTSGILLIFAIIPYIKDISRKDNPITPRPLSWLGWALMMGTSLVAQIITKGWEWNQIALTFSTIGCCIITFLSIRKGIVKLGDWFCLCLGLVCFVFYLFTKDALLTTVLAITSDAIVGFPTLQNAYRNPASEKSIAWNFGAASYFITILSCIGHNFLYAIFPIYLLGFNATMLYLTNQKTQRLR